MIHNSQSQLIYDFLNSDDRDILTFLNDRKEELDCNKSDINLLNAFKKEIIKINNKNYQFTKDQHYIQKAYLEKFINSNWLIEVFDTKNNRISKSISPKSICKEQYYYWIQTWEKDYISQLIETYFKYFEDQFIDVYDEINNFIEKNIVINEVLLTTLCQYISLELLRSPYFRNRIHNLNEQIETHFSINWNIKNNNINHINRILDWNIEKYTNYFKHKKIRIYVSNWERNFVTSDRCIIEVVSEGKDIFSNWFYDRYHYFVLSPRILIEFSNPNFPWKKTKTKRVSKNDVIFFNNLRFMYSKYLYSKDKNDFSIDDYSESRINDLDKYYNLFPNTFKEEKEKFEQCKKIAKEKNIFYKNNLDLINKINSFNFN